MPPDHNQQHPRRPHYHRGRRGPDRRGGDRRPQQQQPQQTEGAPREQLDVEQIMREIRSRISERHGIDLTGPQIQELAARRLEAILDPRAIKPSLMDELRQAAGLPPDIAPSPAEPADTIDESVLYASDNALLRGIRRLLNPILKLLFNPRSVVDALNGYSRAARAAAAQQAEHRQRQTEWNALHFEILRRLVTDIARVEIDNQHLAHRVESLAARVDFNERRVRGLEHTQPPSRTGGRAPDVSIGSSAAALPRDEMPPSEHPSSEVSPDGTRRRRRRRRGRRSGQPRDITGLSNPAAGIAAADQTSDGDEFGDDDLLPEDAAEDVAAAAATAGEAVIEEFEPAAPPSDERLQMSAPELDPVPAAADESSTASALPPAERTDPVPPEQS
jgi:hypothetical protein